MTEVCNNCGLPVGNKSAGDESIDWCDHCLMFVEGHTHSCEHPQPELTTLGVDEDGKDIAVWSCLNCEETLDREDEVRLKLQPAQEAYAEWQDSTQ